MWSFTVKARYEDIKVEEIKEDQPAKLIVAHSASHKRKAHELFDHDFEMSFEGMLRKLSNLFKDLREVEPNDLFLQKIQYPLEPHSIDLCYNYA